MSITPEVIAEIRARHEACAATQYHWAVEFEAHADRATLLLALTEAQERAERATAYTRDLAIAITRKHYPENTAWEPLSDLIGILTQIDNATTGLERQL